MGWDTSDVSCLCRTSVVAPVRGLRVIERKGVARSPVDLEVAVAQTFGQRDGVRGGRHGHRRVQPDLLRGLGGV